VEAAIECPGWLKIQAIASHVAAPYPPAISDQVLGAGRLEYER